MNKKLLVIIFAITIFIIYDIMKNPLLFKNINSFVEKDIEFNVKNSFDSKYLTNFIGNIPYKLKQTNPMVYDINPKDKYKQTIINGYGNCSNYIFGAAYKFLNDEKDFNIIHFYPQDRWKRGGGHTVFLIKQNNTIIIVDLLDGGILINLLQRNPLDIKQQDIKFISMNKLKDKSSQHFPQVMTHDIGIMNSHDIKQYFKFINNIYISLGNKRIEKYLYDGLAVFFGVYPKITIENINTLVNKNEYIKFTLYLWWLRIIGILSIFYIILSIYKKGKK